MNHSKGSCGDAMSSHMPCAQDFRGFYAESFQRVWRRCEGVYDESFERVLRRCDVVRHAMLCRFWGVYDESFERVLRRCDVVRHAMCPRFRGFTMNHSKGSCDDAMSSDMLCAQDYGGLR